MALSAVMLAPNPAKAADPVPPFIAADANWLTTVNYYRAMSGLAPVAENTGLNTGAYNHSCYMLYNGISHDEVPGRTGYTSAGDTAGNNGNVAVSSAYGTTARSHIELWMTGPFHAIGILRHNLLSVGFGKCDMTSSPTSWRSGATLNILSGLGTAPRPANPIVFPGNGTTTNLSQFVTESPNPLDFCGWTGTAGLPVIAMMPEPVATASATMTGPSGPVQVCRIYEGNTSGTAQAILRADNAVSVIPRYALAPGLYTVTVTTQARTVQWSFTVDPIAATGVMPVPTLSPSGSPSALTPMTPFRFADSRKALRITKVLANSVKRVKVAGTAGLPTSTTAISANFTAVFPKTNSYLTVYDCATNRPTASTLNILAGTVVANAGVFPLSADGYICFYSPTESDLLVDINGYFTTSARSTFTGMRAVTALDTQTHLNSTGRLGNDSTVKVDFPAEGLGIPSTAKAVALTITGIQPTAGGYITAYPCGTTRPTVSSVNPPPNSTTSNFAIVPLPANGEVCFYTITGLDLRVDVLGYFTDGGNGTFVPASPARVTDTRDKYRSEMNLGTAGNYLVAGTTGTLDLGGHRGIPTNAKSLSLNLTIAFPTAAGTITMWPCGNQPNYKTITYAANAVTPIGQQMLMSTAGEICVQATTNVHVIVDVTGWWT